MSSLHLSLSLCTVSKYKYSYRKQTSQLEVRDMEDSFASRQDHIFRISQILSKPSDTIDFWFKRTFLGPPAKAFFPLERRPLDSRTLSSRMRSRAFASGHRGVTVGEGFPSSPLDSGCRTFGYGRNNTMYWMPIQVIYHLLQDTAPPPTLSRT